jgi:anthranilate synthase/aminodeoxychorismate synthase-like glutamine amidotransferase
MPRAAPSLRSTPDRRLLPGTGPVVVVDNYDSFTHNVVDLLEQLGARVAVVRNDEVSVEEVLAAGARGVVLSPGPGRPESAGISVPLLLRLDPAVPVLGICLGHQAIALAHGGRVVRARRPLHGTATEVFHRGEGWLRGLPRPFLAARYHSLVVDPRRPGDGLVVTARSAEGEVMALRHRSRPVEGVQFHPESYLTPEGPRLLAAFLRRTGLRPRTVRKVVR